MDQDCQRLVLATLFFGVRQFPLTSSSEDQEPGVCAEQEPTHLCVAMCKLFPVAQISAACNIMSVSAFSCADACWWLRIFHVALYMQTHHWNHWYLKLNGFVYQVEGERVFCFIVGQEYFRISNGHCINNMESSCCWWETWLVTSGIFFDCWQSCQTELYQTTTFNIVLASGLHGPCKGLSQFCRLLVTLKTRVHKPLTSVIDIPSIIKQVLL